MGIHSSFLYAILAIFYLMKYRAKEDIKELSSVTIVNLDLDLVTLASSLQDYYVCYPNPLGSLPNVTIPEKVAKNVVPPLPLLDNQDLYSRL